MGYVFSVQCRKTESFFISFIFFFIYLFFGSFSFSWITVLDPKVSFLSQTTKCLRSTGFKGITENENKISENTQNQNSWDQNTVKYV